MRIDIVTIFPDYLAPLSLSLPGKATARGLLDLHVHDLRVWTHDRHHTVDDTPYGGGAGMVMRPEPWGEALDNLLADAPDDAAPPVLVVPTPAGRPFRQEVAHELAAASRLVFACGRYEGIDQRVLDHARGRMRVEEVSLGDYVLNGGEVAALAIIEAVVRLLPGFMGNPESLAEESHGASGLLEYPVYTKPAGWRGLDVPEVLLGGNHGAIAHWRHDQAVRRTAERRPDLLHPSTTLEGAGLEGAGIRIGNRADAGELLTLQRACWLQEAETNVGLTIPALGESLRDVEAALEEWTTFVVHAAGRLVGSVRGLLREDVWHVGRLMVAPDLQGRGLGRRLLEYAEHAAPPEAASYALVTGAGSERNLRMYRKAGYRVAGEHVPGVLRLTRPRGRPHVGAERGPDV